MTATPNSRDCEHGHQRGKCPYCEAAELYAENQRLLGVMSAVAWQTTDRWARTRLNENLSPRGELDIEAKP